MFLPFTFMPKGLLPPASGEPLACPLRPGLKEGAAGWDLGRRGGPRTQPGPFPGPVLRFKPFLPPSRLQGYERQHALILTLPEDFPMLVNGRATL